MKTLRVVLAFGALFLAACDGSTEPSIYGTYHLETINGEPLPAEVILVEITAGSLRLNADGTYRAETTSRFKGPEGRLLIETDAGTGTFTRTGTALRYSAEDGESFNGTYDGEALTVSSGRFVFGYRRR